MEWRSGRSKSKTGLSAGFESVQDQLRQILNAVGGKSEKTPTGCTPPPKVAKTA